MARAAMLGSLMSATACGSGGHPMAVPTPTGPVSVRLAVDTSTSYVGQTVVLTWSSVNGVSCTAFDGWHGSLPSAGSRSVLVTTPGAVRFNITCANSVDQASAFAITMAAAAGYKLQQTFSAKTGTISTSEGAPYGDTEFWPQVDFSVSNFGYGPTMVQRVYVCLSGMVSMEECSGQAPPTGPLSAQMLAGIDQRLARFASSGKRLLVRFVYNLGPIGPKARDVPVPLILSHIDQLAPVLLKHKDLVFALQGGFIGTWGEWHNSTSGNETPAIRRLVIDRLLHHFGGKFPILLRYPGQMLEYLGIAKPHPYLGLHDDYYASDSNDGGTWAGYTSTSTASPEALKSFAADVSAATMFIGEFGALSASLQSCGNLDAYSKRFGPQSIALGIWPHDIGKALQARGCALSFFNKVGTRIEIQDALILLNHGDHSSARVELTLANTGYGRVVRARPASLILLDGATEVARLAIPLEQFDLRRLKPGAEALSFAFNLQVPHSVAAMNSGSALSAALWVPDPAPSLASQAAYALPLNSVDAAANNVFVPATGLNRLGSFRPN